MNPGSSAYKACPIDYFAVKEDFLQYLEGKHLDSRYAKCLVSYLDRFMVPLASPMDVIRLFSKLTVGQQHNMIRSVRSLFNFLEVTGWSERWLDAMRKAIPKDQTNIDVNVPPEDQIVADLRRISSILLEYQAVYNLGLDSGLRLVEIVKVLNDPPTFHPGKSGFYCHALSYFRKTKQAYFAYFTDYTLRLMQKLNGKEINWNAASKYLQKKKLTAPKYLRKFAFDMMIQLDIPESIADFIEGRVPKRIGAKHYMVLRRQADLKYGRYAEYITKLRQKALN